MSKYSLRLLVTLALSVGCSRAVDQFTIVNSTATSISVSGILADGHTASAQFAASTAVKVTLSAANQYTGYRIGNDDTFDGATFTPYPPATTPIAWQLSSGDGVKTVYAQFQNANGGTTTPVSATIELNTHAPVWVSLTTPATKYQRPECAAHL